MFGGVIYDNAGNEQLNSLTQTLRVVEKGQVNSGTSINFTRAPGNLFVRPAITGTGGVYLTIDQASLGCTYGPIDYVVLGGSNDYTADPSNNFGLQLRDDFGLLTFDSRADFALFKFSGSIPDIANSRYDLPLSAPYPGQNIYISALSLGLSQWQVGSTYITWHKRLFSQSTNQLTAIFTDLEEHTGNSGFPVEKYDQFGPYTTYESIRDTYSLPLPNNIYLIQV